MNMTNEEKAKAYNEAKAKYAHELFQKNLPFKKVYGVVEKNGKYVVLKLKQGSIYKYFLSGGGVDEGEDNVTAVKREMVEELNMNVEVVKSLGTCECFRTWTYKGKSVDVRYETEIFLTKFVSYSSNKDFGLEGEFSQSRVTGIVEVTKDEMINNVEYFVAHEIKFEK